jgi:hypothetical protein
MNDDAHDAQRVTLSLRPEDNTGLEDFLIREFFGSAPPTR